MTIFIIYKYKIPKQLWRIAMPVTKEFGVKKPRKPKKEIQVIVPEENEDVTVTVDRSTNDGVLLFSKVVMPAWAFGLQLLITGISIINLYFQIFKF